LSRLELPGNVHLFRSDRVEWVGYVRGDEPVAAVGGRSWSRQRPLRAAEFSRETRAGFQLAVLYGRGDVEANIGAGIDYWALGGSRAALDVASDRRRAVHCPGSPQGFCPGDGGPHGCTLVSVDGDGEIRMRRIETDVVRWRDEQFEVSEGRSVRDVRQALTSRLDKLAAGQRRPLLVTCRLTGAGRFHTPLVRRNERDELLDRLRDEFGHRAPPVWPLSLTIEPPETIPSESCDDDTILGDFLRAIRDHLEEGAQAIDLERYLPQRTLPGDLVEALSLSDTSAVAALREAAVLGADLLRGDEPTGLG
jgi:hypothetical protein